MSKQKKCFCYARSEVKIKSKCFDRTISKNYYARSEDKNKGSVLNVQLTYD